MKSCIKVRTIWILICVVLVEFGNSVMLHQRQKRYLHFPDKSSFTMTLTLLRQTAVTFPLLNTLHELDFGFRLPQHPEEIFYKKYTKPKQRERREIHQSMQHVAQLLGSGSKCCLSQLVHSRSPQQSEHSEEDLLTDILTIVFDSLKPIVPPMDSCNATCAMTTQREELSAFLHSHLQLMHSQYTI